MTGNTGDTGNTRISVTRYTRMGTSSVWKRRSCLASEGPGDDRKGRSTFMKQGPVYFRSVYICIYMCGTHLKSRLFMF